MHKITQEEQTKIIDEIIESIRQGREKNFADVVGSLLYAVNKHDCPSSLEILLKDLRLVSVKVSI